MGKVLVIGNADFSNVAVKKVDFLKGTYIKITPTLEGADSLVSGDGFYAIGETATLSAASNTLYSFVKWSDGVTNSVRTITVASEGNLTLYAEYETNFSYNDFIWGNGGIGAVGTSSGSLNSSASTVSKLIHTLSECSFMINPEYADDFTIAAYALSDTKPTTSSWPNGTYYPQYNQSSITIALGGYLQINIKNTEDVSFTSDLSLCSEILLVDGEYELITK